MIIALKSPPLRDENKLIVLNEALLIAVKGKQEVWTYLKIYLCSEKPHTLETDEKEKDGQGEEVLDKQYRSMKERTMDKQRKSLADNIEREGEKDGQTKEIVGRQYPEREGWPDKGKRGRTV